MKTRERKPATPTELVIGGIIAALILVGVVAIARTMISDFSQGRYADDPAGYHGCFYGSDGTRTCLNAENQPVEARN